MRSKKLSGGFLAIIVFKYFKALVFVLVAVAAVRLARLDQFPSPEEIAHFLRSSPENELVRWLSRITPGQARGFGLLSLFVAAVFAAEGTLLSARIWWSTYFTVALTACGIPLELYEILQRPSFFRRYAVLAINAAILAYLLRRRNEFRGRI